MFVKTTTSYYYTLKSGTNAKDVELGNDSAVSLQFCFHFTFVLVFNKYENMAHHALLKNPEYNLYHYNDFFFFFCQS